MKSDSIIDGPLLIVTGPAAKSLAPGAHARMLARIGAAVRTARLCRGMSLPRLSRETGVPKTTLAEIEEGRSDFRVSSLALIEAALGVSPGWLMRTTR